MIVERADQLLDALNKIGIDQLEPIRMIGDVLRQESEKTAKQRVVYLSRCGPRDNHLAVRTNRKKILSRLPSLSARRTVSGTVVW